VLIELCVKNQF